MATQRAAPAHVGVERGDVDVLIAAVDVIERANQGQRFGMHAHDFQFALAQQIDIAHHRFLGDGEADHFSASLAVAMHRADLDAAHHDVLRQHVHLHLQVSLDGVIARHAVGLGDLHVLGQRLAAVHADNGALALELAVAQRSGSASAQNALTLSMSPRASSGTGISAAATSAGEFPGLLVCSNLADDAPRSIAIGDAWPENIPKAMRKAST